MIWRPKKNDRKCGTDGCRATKSSSTHQRKKYSQQTFFFSSLFHCEIFWVLILYCTHDMYHYYASPFFNSIFTRNFILPFFSLTLAFAPKAQIVLIFFIPCSFHLFNVDRLFEMCTHFPWGDVIYHFVHTYSNTSIYKAFA